MMSGGLKSLELQGYKTFANRTLFEFAEAVTAIVGPNGSGKSNIADSLRWVFGEQSYSLLRGKKTEDMIFSGSELRPRSGMASATVTLDNSDGWLPIDFSEVAITRRAYRDGANEYLINGQRVRLKDVSELLAQSGLAERTYTIIGQGLVDAALALKAEDRRKLFEEAAGIGLYRSRREEARTRLETTRRNLERVQDILTELEPRLRSLEKQARRAQEYEQVKIDLQVLLRDWYGYHWHRTQQDLMEARDVERVAAASLESSRAEQFALNQHVSALRQRIQSQRQQLNEWLRQSTELHTRREVLNRDLAVADERARSLEQQIQTTQDESARLVDETGLQEELISSVEMDIRRLEGDLQEARSQVEQASQALSQRQNERSQVDGQVLETRQKLGELNSQQGQLEARLAEKTAQIGRDQKALETAFLAAQRAEKEGHEAVQRQQVAQDILTKAEQIHQTAEEALRVQGLKLGSGELARKELMDQLSKSESELERLKARWEILEQAEAAYSGYAEGTRRLLQAVSQERLQGKPGALNQYLDVSAEFEQAISAALGDFLEAVLLEVGPDDALKILDSETGRAALIPLAYLKKNRIPEPRLPFEGLETGWIGVASELVQTTADMRVAVDLLLGAVWVVRDRDTALALLQKMFWGDSVDPGFADLRIVTLKGEVYYASGVIITGRNAEEDNGQTLLSRQRQRKELQELRLAVSEKVKSYQLQDDQLETELSAMQTEVEILVEQQRASRQRLEQTNLSLQQARLAADQAAHQANWQQEQRRRLQDQINIAENEVGQLRNDLDKLETDIHTTRDHLRELNNTLAEMMLDEFQTQVAHWNTRAAVIERALGDERRRLEERRQDYEKADAQSSHLQERLNDLKMGKQTLLDEKTAARSEEVQINQAILALQQVIEPGESELRLLESEQAKLEETEAAARQAVSLSDHRHAQSRIILARRQEALQSLQRRIEEDFGLVAFDYADQVSGQAPLPLEGMVEQLPRLTQLAPEIDEAIKRQRAQLRRMGPINPEAQAEYKNVKERFNFMTEQIADLRRAEEDIREVIQELDGLMQRDFLKTFEAVAAEFKAIFQRLFGGGSARLVLTDPDNLTDTGIDIEARLPGRRTQGLSLLSGGERSLTATALVFALIKVSPTPFCVLDEVDAMLDEANVGRFRELLQELSQRTQFVIVTHNRNTVQAADVIYGVTMGRDSTSQVVSLKMDQVAQVFD
jgi:chromosome segregation protein